jgi:glycosyltransferase involved in cell wall biosynthesis
VPRARFVRGAILAVPNAHRRPRVSGAPLVSVVIPTYNWSSVLRHSVRSALDQRYPAVEVIVIGDCCTDDSEAVVASIGDGRVRWENLPVNNGSQSIPNNRGLELARGEYVAYLGHDDLWHPDHLAYLVSAVHRSGGGVGVATALWIGPPGSNATELHPDLPSAASAAMHRRDAIDRAGPWRDYRTIDQTPDFEFMNRVIASEGLVLSNALTVFKFPSAWRPGSYVERRDDEQVAYAARIGKERLMVERELGRWLWRQVNLRKKRLPEVAPAPANAPQGWRVAQFRKIRGLPEKPS